MVYFIYKTTHNNGKYYIGRHSTNNENDGYMGSGRWVRSIKDRSTLSREILEYAESTEILVELERKYLDEHYGKEDCMNMTRDPIGASKDNYPMMNPESVQKISGENHWLRKNPERCRELSECAQELVKNNKHNFQGDRCPNKDGSVSRRTSELGHNVFQTNNPSIWRSEEGIHHWQNGNSPNAGGKLNAKLVAEGTHNFLGPDSNRKMLESGTHPSQQKCTCEHCGMVTSLGMYKRWHGDNCRKKN